MATSRRANRLALIFVGLGLILLGSLAWQGETWAAPPGQGTIPPGGLPGPVSCTIPEGGGICTNPGIPVTVTFPAGAVPAGSVVTITPKQPAGPVCVMVGGVGYDMSDHLFVLTVVGPDGKAINQFAAAVTITITYNATDLANAGNNPQNFDILFYDPTKGVWVKGDLSAPTIDATKMTVSVTVTHPGEFALFFKGAPCTLPVTGQALSPTMLFTLPALLLGAALVALGLVRIRRTG